MAAFSFRATAHAGWGRKSSCCFPSDEKSRLLKLRIEQILGSRLGSDRPTQTV